MSKPEPLYKSDPAYLKDQVRLGYISICMNMAIVLALIAAHSMAWAMGFIIFTVFGVINLELNKAKLVKVEKAANEDPRNVPVREASDDVLQEALIKVRWREMAYRDKIEAIEIIEAAIVGEQLARKAESETAVAG